MTTEERELQSILSALTKQVQSYQSQMDELEDSVGKLLRQPADRRSALPHVRAGEKFLGYNLGNQGMELKTQSDETKDQVSKWLIAKTRMADRSQDWSPEIMKTYGDASLIEGDNARGGYTIPVEYSTEILGFARAVSFILQNGRSWPMSSATKKIPKELNLVSVDWTDEEVDLTESEPTFSELLLTAKKLGGIGVVSNEMLQDSEIDIVSLLTSQFGEAIGVELDNQSFNGTGSPCSGLLTAACGQSVVMTPGNAFSAVTGDHISLVISKLSANKLTGARFAISRTPLHYLRTAKVDASYCWGGMANNDPATLWGFPFGITEQITNTTGTSTPFCVFGNFQNFAVGTRLASWSLDLDPFTFFKSYRTQFRVVSRFALAIAQAEAFVRLMTGAV
jgi:HK97 family phage major capsid protein